MNRLRRWAGRAALAGAGVIAALALIEGLLRLAGQIYQPPGARSGDPVLAASGAYRVLCLGESTTAGIESGDRSYPYQLEQILNREAAGKARFEVINAGRPGTTSDVIVAKLPELLARHEPDAVVTMMGVNDGHLIDPVFQTGGSLRVWKLLKMLYHSYRPPPDADLMEDLLVRAKAALEHRPDTAAELAAQASRLAPGDPRGMIALAEAEVMQDRMESAATSYLQAFEVDAPALVAYSFEVEPPHLGVLDWVMSRLPRQPHALAARAAMALRRQDLAGAEYYSRRATELDPRHTVALVVNGRALQLLGSEEAAATRFEEAAAANLRLASILASNRVVGTPDLAEAAVREHQRGGGSGAAAATTSDERWFARAQQELDEGLRGLQLQQSWQRIATGQTEAAAHELRRLAQSTDEVSVRVRLRALGQLAVLAWQRGNATEAERHHEEVERLLRDGVNTMTAENYRELWRVLHQRGIPLVAVQYPVRRLEPLRQLLVGATGVVFVDNERPFKDALLGRPYTEIFSDLFAGDFGHMTAEGNRILAANVAEAVLALIPALERR